MSFSLHCRHGSEDKAKMNKKTTAFGGGIRVCPGGELGKLQVAFFLHHLVLSYRWKTKSDEMPIAHPYVEFKRGMLLEIEATTLSTPPLGFRAIGKTILDLIESHHPGSFLRDHLIGKERETIVHSSHHRCPVYCSVSVTIQLP
ncbi:hypothetical protein Rs2_41142 [Raphanus sativus]|nr:hypothetical protein Rs2_41142 [Raphanus sativus]